MQRQFSKTFVQPRRQYGGVVVLFAVCLLAMLGVLGLAYDAAIGSVACFGLILPDMANHHMPQRRQSIEQNRTKIGRQPAAGEIGADAMGWNGKIRAKAAQDCRSPVTRQNH